ncbi:hypothetical protein [Nocardioides sp.]|uniref:hypothetical protein n=1 Tax=Nocardioides sp. TaxID=35761 RepID=UPI002C9F9D31|nr:hypothetical protein [Nocardioides sp.]HSX67608.1 hypothetical protein [Nocardioides sp.]
MPTSDEQLRARLRDLEDEARTLADVEVETYEGTTISTVHVDPRSPAARSMSWTDLGDELILEVGTHGGRWELELNEGAIAFLEDVVRSVMAGRVRETFGRGRSRVEVTLADGSSAVETGYVSWLPTPGWKKRGRVVQYGPY